MLPISRTLLPRLAAGSLIALTSAWVLRAKVDSPNPRTTESLWRAEHRIVDLHMHIDGSPERYDRAVRIMDKSGIGIGVNLSGGTVTSPADGSPSPFARTKLLADTRHPGRFVHYMNLDYAGWDNPDFSSKAAAQIAEGHRLGAAGLKEYKRLGLYLRDSKEALIAIDDPKLDAVWAKCGDLNMPVSIHVADPRAFWLAFDDKNERWKELKDHRSWWFGDPAKFPPREQLLEALNRVIARHPKTTFVCVHFANNAEDLAWVDRMLDAHPNMMADLAARIPEIGRHDPAEVRRVFTKHANRIFFASDFMVYDRLILGSAGDDERPTDDDGAAFYDKCWRWIETSDRDWAHMTPIQGDWKINSISLPPAVSRKIYFDNATKLLAASLPLPVMKAAHVASVPEGTDFSHPAWAQAVPVRMEYSSSNAAAHPALSTTVRALWTNSHLHLAYECPFTILTTFGGPHTSERIGLWEKDVVEAFIAPDPAKPNSYSEYEWSPDGGWLDLTVAPDKKDFAWNSGMSSTVTIDQSARIWRLAVSIPLAAISPNPPTPGTRWKINLFRHDTASRTGLALSPTLTNTFHTPARFASLEFLPPTTN